MALINTPWRSTATPWSISAIRRCRRVTPLLPVVLLLPVLALPPPSTLPVLLLSTPPPSSTRRARQHLLSPPSFPPSRLANAKVELAASASEAEPRASLTATAAEVELGGIAYGNGS
jgi:hypothetical protein